MKDFIDKNKNLVVVVASLLLLGSLFISFKKAFFYSPPAGEKPVFLPATEEDVFSTSPDATMAGTKTNFVPIAGFAALLTVGAIGASLFFKKSTGKEGKKKTELFVERDKKRKEDIERLQAMIEVYYKMNGVYPSPSQFEELKADLEPVPKDPLEGQKVDETDNTFGYYYDNWDSKTSKNTTATYRLWAFLENENDPIAKDGKYLVTPETYGKKLEVPEAPVLEEKPEEKMP